MKSFLMGALVILSTLAFAEAARKFDYTGFGKKIELKKQGSSDKVAFGVVFSLGASDPDGSNWFLNLTRNGAFPKGTSWNLYRKDSDSYQFSQWKDASAGELFAARLANGEAQKILPHQKDLVLVFKLPSGELMHLPIGDMCEDMTFKDYFKNLTDSKRCFEVTEDDVKQDEVAASPGKRQGHHH